MAFANIWQWLKTAASNTSLNGIALGENVMLPSGVNNAFREFMSQIATVESKGTDVASATTLALGTERYYHVTGTTTITDIDFTDAVDGRWAWLIFDGALTLTHNSTTLILPGGANITTAAGDRALFVQDSSDNIICLAFVKASGLPVADSSLVHIAGTETVTGEKTFSAALAALTFQSGAFTVADDAAAIVTTPIAVGGTITLMPNSLAGSAGYGIFRLTSSQIGLLASATSGFTVTTGVLTGTTGADGGFNISVSGGNIYIENRSGVTRTYRYAFHGS